MVPNVITPLAPFIVVVIARSKSNVVVRLVPFKSTFPLVLISPLSVFAPVPCNVRKVKASLLPIDPRAIAPLPFDKVNTYRPFTVPKLKKSLLEVVRVRSAPPSVVAPVYVWLPVVVTLPPRLVVPLTEILLRLVRAAEIAKLPVRFRYLPPPFRVELNVTNPVPLPAERLVSAPSVVASPYV